MKKITILFIFFFTNLLLFAQGSIINVPENFSKIQDAINSSADGDTIIVAPGRYFENINFKGKKIVLASNYILDKDINQITSTIIDGSQPTTPDSGSVVLFVSKEDHSSVLQGFTITGGTGTKTYNKNENLYFRTGGGILINECSPTIINNIITYNKSVDIAGGVRGAGGGGMRVGNGLPVIKNNIISHNTGRYAGGIMIAFCSGLRMENNIIAFNKALGDFDGGGGIYVDWRPIFLINNTIVYNYSGGKGGGIISTGTPTNIKNCIIYGNSAKYPPYQIFKRYNGSANVRFSNIQAGWSGNENIDINPKFVDSTSFFLSDDSPCIDAGENTTNYKDMESSTSGEALFPSKGTTRNDMGAYGGPKTMTIVNPVTNIDSEEIKTPNNFKLYQNYPNPFNPTTTISYNIPVSNRASNVLKNVTLKIYNILGKEVTTLVNEIKSIGSYKVQFNANNLTSGVYYYQLKMGSFIETKKLILVK